MKVYKLRKTKINPHDVPSGHADWMRRKQGAFSKAKPSRSVRNRVEVER